MSSERIVGLGRVFFFVKNLKEGGLSLSTFNRFALHRSTKGAGDGVYPHLGRW